MNNYTRNNNFNPTFYPYTKRNSRYKKLVKEASNIYQSRNLSEVILKFGMNGVEVEELQKILVSLNYLKGKPDGYFGKSTEKAVLNFQKDSNQVMDGIVGPITWTYLEKTQNEEIPVNEPTIKEGDSNLFVTSLQMKLNALGYLKEEPDSVFGSSTERAVREFQRANNLIIDGIVGPDTWRIINHKYSELDSPVPVIIEPMLEGTSGENVETLQKNLSSLGYYEGNITGSFDIPTGNSVQRFQSDNGLLSTGIVNQKTWESIAEKLEENNRSEINYQKNNNLHRQKKVLSRPTIRLGDSGNDVADLQRYLKELTYFDGTIDSQFGSETNRAVRSFQNTNNLLVDGIVGRNTWSALVNLYSPLAICLPDDSDRYIGVVIDAGHGGEDPGAVSQGVSEKNYNLMISQYMAERFSELGIPYSLTRDSDETLTNTERVARIKRPFGDVSNAIVISNHINAGGGEGAEIIYPIRSNETLSRNILTEIGNAGQKTRTYYQKTLPNDPTRDYYYIMRDTDRLQTLIVEYAFLDNINDLTRLQNNWESYAEATVKAVAEYMGYPYTQEDLNGLVYTVVAGDSLWAIAKKFGTTVENIKRLNNLSSNNLSIGQKLIISGSQTPEPEPTPTSIHTVVAGDTLYSIARRYNTTVSELRRLNNLSSDILSIGQNLVITETNSSVTPELPIIYIVKVGDTLWSIANNFDVTVDTIKKANNLTSSNLSIGQELLISKESIIPSLPAENIIYTVKQGDTLWSLAQKYNTTVNKIKNVNNLSNNSLSIGQSLIIPDGLDNLNVYTVTSGDTLWNIASRFGTTVAEIRKLNNLNNNLLNIGQQLKIPII